MADTQGDGAAKADIIAINVKDQDGGELMFKVKPNTKLSKVMDVYCQKKSKDRQSVRFLFDGDRIPEEATPAGLGIEDGDTIDVVIHQLGGCSLQHSCQLE